MKIIATWHHDYNRKQYNCAAQVASMSKRHDSERAIDSFKNRNGCGRISDRPRKTHGPINFHNCYCDHLHPNFNHYLFLYEQYSKGNYAYSGSLIEQPNHYIELMKVIDTLKTEADIEMQKAQIKASSKPNKRSR